MPEIKCLFMDYKTFRFCFKGYGGGRGGYGGGGFGGGGFGGGGFGGGGFGGGEFIDFLR